MHEKPNRLWREGCVGRAVAKEGQPGSEPGHPNTSEAGLLAGLLKKYAANLIADIRIIIRYVAGWRQPLPMLRHSSKGFERVGASRTDQKCCFGM